MSTSILHSFRSFKITNAIYSHQKILLNRNINALMTSRSLISLNSIFKLSSCSNLPFIRRNDLINNNHFSSKNLMIQKNSSKRLFKSYSIKSNQANIVSENKTMKLAVYENKESEQSVGIVCGSSLWPLSSCVQYSKIDLNDIISVMSEWDNIKNLIEIQGEGTDLQKINFLAPNLNNLNTIFCIGKNYVDHIKEVDTWKINPNITEPSVPKHPIVFTKALSSMIGHKQNIIIPKHLSIQIDYEAELGVLIGKEGKNISRENAMDYVFGYTIINDVTARDIQKKHQQWLLGKSCDSFCPMGPFIVPASQIDGQDLRIQCWINDELRQNGHISQLIFSIPEIIETISKGMTLRVGDVIATGTPSGVGSGFDPPKFLKSGDVVRIKIEGIGELINQVVD